MASHSVGIFCKKGDIKRIQFGNLGSNQISNINSNLSSNPVRN